MTEDSFSDGGRYLDPGAALAHARALHAGGADVIDLGAASSHPDSKRVEPAEEQRRLAPLLAALVADGIRCSVDSYEPATQRFAMRAGARILNDVGGFADETLWPELAAWDGALVVMHSVQRRGPATRTSRDPEQVWSDLIAFFEQRLNELEGAGIARERIFVDPGMGFFLGDQPAPSLYVLRHLPELKRATGCRTLVSVSRKSFLGELTGRPVAERGAATLAAELHAARAGVDAIRSHDPRSLRDALVVQEALAKDPRSDPGTH